MPEADPHLLKLVRELDAERTRRVKAERKAATLQAQFAKLRAQRITADAKPKALQRPE